jgi:hypothetical protein
MTTQRTERHAGACGYASFRGFPYQNSPDPYRRDRNHRWHRYRDAEPTPAIATLLTEIHRDPTGIFWV